MSSVTALQKIHDLTHIEEIPASLRGRVRERVSVEQRVEAIAEIIKEAPDLAHDPKIMKRCFRLAKKSDSPDVLNFLQDWAFQVSCKQEGGIYNTIDFPAFIPSRIRDHVIDRVKEIGFLNVKESKLTLSHQAVEKLGNCLWDVVQKEKVKTLSINGYDYKDPILTLLQEKRPPVKFLHETATILFRGELELTLPKATLIACGDYFAAAFSGNFKVSDEIDLTENVTLNGFNGILSELETGRQDPKTRKEDLEKAIDFLITTLLFPAYPKGIYGPKEWEEHFGVVDDFPPPPALVQEVQELKSQGKDPLVCLIPTTVGGKPFCHNLLAKLIQNPKKGHKTEIRYFSKLIDAKLKNLSPDKPYYILMDKDVLAGTRNKSPKVQKDLVPSDYEVSKFLASETAILLHYVKTGERLFSEHPLTYTRCVEIGTYQGVDYPVVVGGFSPDGLDVHNNRYDDDSIGLAPVRKFYRP